MDASTIRARFAGIDTWVFDLDNTLYSAGDGIFSQVHRRMTRFIVEHYAMDHDSARALQRQLFHRYGTTMNGLMVERDLDPHHYLEYVHDIDLDVIEPAPALDNLLGQLPGRCLVYTNGSAPYAGRILDRLGITHRFDSVFDIVAAAFEPKPSTGAFDRFLDQHAVDPARACMIEDIAKNLAPAKARGMLTVWLREDSEHAHHHHERHPSEPGRHDTPPDYVDLVIDDLDAWLRLLVEPAASSSAGSSD